MVAVGKMEELCRSFQQMDDASVSYQNDELTITFPRGQALIRQGHILLLAQGAVWDETDWDENRDPDELVQFVEAFAGRLEDLGRRGNETYQAARRAAARRCGRIPLLFFLAMLVCFAALAGTGDAWWLLAALVCPVAMVVLLAAVQGAVFRRHWVCPRCGQPLPLTGGRLFSRIKYVANCPHCGCELEQMVPEARSREKTGDKSETGQPGPDPAPPRPGSPWPARLCGLAGAAFAVFLALVEGLARQPGPGLAAALTGLALCLVISLVLFFCRAPAPPCRTSPLVVVRESRLVLWVGIPLWLAGLALVFGGVALTTVTPPEAGYIAFLLGAGLAAQFSAAGLLLARRNRALYIWEAGSFTRLVYVSSWGRLHPFDAADIAGARMTVNRSIHLLDAAGKKLAGVETNMPGASRFSAWMETRGLKPTLTPAMRKLAEKKGDVEPPPVCWRKEYRTRWHDHLRSIRAGMWAALLLLGVGGVLPAVLYLGGVLPFIAMIWLITLAPLPFFVFCFVFSPVLLFGEWPKNATGEWKAMHIKVPFGWLLLFALAYLGQTNYLWSRWVLQVAGNGLDWLGQTALVAAVLIALFALVTPRRLRAGSAASLGAMLVVFSFTGVYGVNLMLCGPAGHSPLVVVDSHMADPADEEDEYTLTLRLEDGSETELYVSFSTLVTALTDDKALVLCRRESPLGLVFLDIHPPRAGETDGPAIGGLDDAESLRTARELKEQSSDYAREGCYADLGRRIRMGVEAGTPCSREEARAGLPAAL